MRPSPDGDAEGCGFRKDRSKEVQPANPHSALRSVRAECTGHRHPTRTPRFRGRNRRTGYRAGSYGRFVGRAAECRRGDRRTSCQVRASSRILARLPAWSLGRKPLGSAHGHALRPVVRPCPPRPSFAGSCTHGNGLRCVRGCSKSPSPMGGDPWDSGRYQWPRCTTSLNGRRLGRWIGVSGRSAGVPSVISKAQNRSSGKPSKRRASCWSWTPA